MLEHNWARNELNFKLHVHTYCTLTTTYGNIYFNYEKQVRRKKKLKLLISHFLLSASMNVSSHLLIQNYLKQNDPRFIFFLSLHIGVTHSCSYGVSLYKVSTQKSSNYWLHSSTTERTQGLKHAQMGSQHHTANKGSKHHSRAGYHCYMETLQKAFCSNYLL